VGFVAAFTVKFNAHAFGSFSFSRNPGSGNKRRVVTNVLKMSTRKRGPPMAFVISIERCDSLFQIVSDI